MQKVHFLSVYNTGLLSRDRGPLAPILRSTERLRALGWQTKCFNTISDELFDCDVVFAFSRYFYRGNREEAEFSFKQFREKATPPIIWFDERDSAGNTQFEVLPHVALYLKKQLYHDQNAYLSPLYGNRLFTNFYHQNFGVEDDYTEALSPLDPKLAKKISVGWNLGLQDIDMRLRGKVGKALALLQRAIAGSAHIAWGDPSQSRTREVMALFSTNYARNTIAWQRQTALRILRSRDSTRNLIGQRVPMRDYVTALYDSKIVISLFGWGEVCYREWEASIGGSAIVMPDMSGIDTWPDLYQANHSYAPVKWDLSDLDLVIDELLDEPQKRAELARNAQNLLHFQYTEAGVEEFAKRIALHLSNALNTPASSSPA